MKTLKGLKSIFALASLGAVTALSQGAASAQTTANGPYYATPSWDQTLPANTRFVVLSNFNSAAVLDRETGLVWQRNPDSELQNTPWSTAAVICHSLGTRIDVLGPVSSGNRAGWRLPSVEELSSLVDRTTTNPALTPGHPFQGIQNTFYWTASSEEDVPTNAYVIDLGTGLRGFAAKQGATGVVRFNYWCVRGGSSVGNPTLP